MNYKRLTVSGICAFLLLAGAHMAYAQTSGATPSQGSANINPNLSYTPLEPLPGLPNPESANFCQLVNLGFKYSIYFGGMVAVVFLVLGGITYMFSEVVDKRSAARERIKAALYGLAILLGSWLILNTINPQLVKTCNILAPSTLLGTDPISSPPPDAAQQDRQNCTDGQIWAFPKRDLLNQIFPAWTCDDIKRMKPGTQRCDLLRTDSAGTNYYCIR